MIPVAQRIAHLEENGEILSVGDCLRACIASVLEAPYEDIPHFVDEHGGDWWQPFAAWCEERGLQPWHYDLDGSMTLPDWLDFGGYWIASVTSPRNKPDDADPYGTHAVVMHGSELVWDPHPGPFKRAGPTKSPTRRV